MSEREQLAAAVDAARAVLGRVGSLGSAPAGEVEELLSGTAALSRIVDALQVRLAGVIEERSEGPAARAICRAMGRRDAKEAVARAFGIRSRDAAALLSMAAMTSPGVTLTGGAIAVKYPRVGAALDAGAVSLAQARAIVRELEPAAPRADLDQLAWAEDALVTAATDPDFPLVPELLTEQARLFAAVLDPDGVLPSAERQRAERSFRMWRAAHGGWAFRGDFTAEDGSLLKSVLDATSGPRVKVAFHADGHDGCGDGCGDDCEAGRQVDANGQPSADGVGIVDDRTLAQKHADVLIGLARGYAASGDAPVAGGEAPTLVFVGTIEAYDAYLHDRPTPERTLTIEHTGALVPIETVGRLACDSIIHHAVLNGVGQVLNLGRTERLFNRAQRRALAARDKGCRVPGCGMPAAWCEAHHITPWDDGGPTDIDWGILVCTFHHHEIHADRLRVEAASDQPGHWRIVPELRAADRYARATRNGAARAPESSREDRAAIASTIAAIRATGTLACAATPSLAVKVPDAASDAAISPPTPVTRASRRRIAAHLRPHGIDARWRSGAIEPRLRALLDRRRKPSDRLVALDLGPPSHISLRL